MNEKKDNHLISINRKANHEYFIEDRFEAGLILQGWEVKSLRAGRFNFTDSHIIVRQGIPKLIGAHISFLPTTAKHTEPDPMRSRVLLLHAKEIRKLIGLTERKGYTLVPLRLYWKGQRVKLEFALAKGKKLHDKRQSERDKEGNKNAARAMATYKKRTLD